MAKRPHCYVHRAGSWYSFYMNEENEARLREFADVTTPAGQEMPRSEEELIRGLEGVDAILSLNGIGADEITTDVLRSVGTVKVAAISHWWHGSHCKAKAMWEDAGVEVLDASDGNNEAVAEWCLGVAIMGARQLLDFDRALKGGDLWAEPRREAGLISESVVGLVGLGRVGRIFARHLVGIGATVLAYDKYVSAAEGEALGVKMVPLEEALGAADIVSFHLPVTDETRGIIGAKELATIRDGAVVINSARTAVLDNEAFMAELQRGRFRAFLDVFHQEPLPLDDPIRSMDNVFITPHIAGDNGPMFIRCGRMAIDALREWFERE